MPRWFWWVTAAALSAASLPYLFAYAIQPEGSLYLGVHSNYDDHAVYAAWTKQAQEGRLFFENRFTTDEQAGRTIHLYFAAAGQLAKITGIPLALHVFRIVFGFLALLGLYRLITRIVDDEGKRKTVFALSIVCAGIGFLFWRNYGFDGPIDVWQPEAFVFPMLMQNGLFCAALWLITVVWVSILDARESWKPVAFGAVAMLALTNIHTYDTLLIAIVSAGFLAAMVGARNFSLSWLGRALVIALGAAPAVAWFVYVRGIDPVFAARADTETFSAPLWNVILGIFPAILLAGAGLEAGGDRRAVIGGGLLIAAVAGLQKAQGYAMGELWAQTPLWIAIATLAIGLCWLYRPKSAGYGLLFAWCLLGVIALYYPGLFQRKLAMALVVPYAISAALFLCSLEVAKKHIAVVAGGAFLGLSSVLWLVREASMATSNISNTTMQRIYWPQEVNEFLTFFQEKARADDAVIAMPGVAVPDDFENPRSYTSAIPDLNPVMSGWGGVTTYIGHWSETPGYIEKRGRVMRDMFSPNATASTVFEVMSEARANYIIAPVGEIAELAGVPPRDFYTRLGEVIFEGDEFVLVRYLPAP